MLLFICPNKCCTLKIMPYNDKRRHYDSNSVYNSLGKAGVVLHDTDSDKILIVQSRGHLWGPPKGSLKYGESHRVCAIRELKEETGITVNSEYFTRAVNLHNRAVYFYMKSTERDVTVQQHLPDNDANGIGWIKLECLQHCINNGNICLSKHCQIVLKRLFNRTFTHPVFTQVTRKKKK